MSSFDALSSCTSSESLIEEASRQVSLMGFDLWTFAIRMRAGLQEDRSVWSIGNFPLDLEQARNDCFVQLTESAADAMRDGIPYAWLTASEPSPGSAGFEYVRAFRQCALGVGVHGGVCVPVQGRAEAIGSLALAVRREVSLDAIRAMQSPALLFSRYLNAACQPYVAAFRAHRMPRLSSRESECLSWAAMGKTTWEISRVLDISEHTVIFHLRNAAGKLGVVSRQHAVAKAIEFGILAMNGSMAGKSGPVQRRMEEENAAFLG
jgi:DNA-binding CsgD family transcriptional regulator